MTQKYTLKIYPEEGHIVAAQIRNPDKLVIDPVAKRFLLGIATVAATAWAMFSLGLRDFGWAAVTLCFVLAVCFLAWLAIRFDDTDRRIVERKRYLRDEKVDKPFLTLPHHFYDSPNYRDLRNVRHRLNTYLQNESTAPRVGQIIEAGIQAHELVTDRSSRVDLSAKLIEKLAALEAQLKEEQDMKRKTAEDHIELLLGKD